MKKPSAPLQAHLLLGLTLLLVLLGGLFVFESSIAESYATYGNEYQLLKQHLLGLAVGLVGFVIALKTPTKFWLKTAPIWFIASLLFMILVLIPGIGLELNGARRWISVAGFRLQPVEFLKLAIVLYFPLWLSRHQRLGPFLALTGIPMLLLLLQPDLGSSLIIITISTALYFLAGGNLKHISFFAAAGIPLVIAAILFSPYRLQRVTTFLNPESDPLGASFHIRQMTIALGRGGWIGQGLGNSSQKFSFIPEASTDSIFAIIAEELGFLGSLVILGLFGAFFYLLYQIAALQTEPVEQLLVLGILVWIGSQTILNLAAVVGLVPLTGIPLPFFSYGRSAQVMLLFATGLVIRKSYQS